MTAIGPRALLLVVVTGLALGTAEIVTRVIDGYRLVSVHLEPLRSRIASAALSHGTRSPKWEGDADALPYVEQLPLAPGVDRDWFTARMPDRAVSPPDADLEARRKRYPGADLDANYEWNRKAVINSVCRGGGLHDFVAFDRFDDVYLFDAIDGSDLPTFRFLRNATYPSGLRTNAFGWRGSEIALNKPPHSIRIAFVGASTTVSPHAEPYSYPELVGLWLRRWTETRHPEISVEVINGGREGINSGSIQAIVRQELTPLEPDLIVYYEGSNQFWPNDFLPTPPLRSRVMGVVRHGPLLYSALANRFADLVRKSWASGAEPAKPRMWVDWPPDLDERDPDLDDPRLPIALPTILHDLETIRQTVEENNGELVMTSFAWLVYPGMVVDPARDAYLLSYLNVKFWPFSYAHLRRFVDFQSRVFRKYASVHHLDFIDVAAAYPRDPRLFDDAIHMTHAGIRLQAWVVFNGLVPIIERRLASHEWPRPSRHRLTVHPAFGERRLVPMSEVRAACK